MWRFSIILIAFFALSAQGAEHDVFKTCDRVSFCAEFRNQILDSSSQFAANVSAGELANGVATVPLYNSQNESLTLSIYLLSENKARVKISEPDNNRYELEGVLDPYPQTIVAQITNNETVVIILSKDSSNLHKIIVTSGPPFTVEFYVDDILEVALNGDRLVMENSEDSQAFGFGVEFVGASILYGLHHHAWQLALTETADGSMDPFRLKNVDNVAYDAHSPMAMYGSIPVVYGHSANLTSGIFLHNAAQQWVDISYANAGRPSTYFMVEGGIFDLFVLLGPTPKEVIRQYTQLTGVPHLPQLWALGYHQNRFTYWTQEEVKEVVAKMDSHNFPMDVIWLDDGHSNGNRYFQWNPENFTDPVEMQQNVSSTGRVIVSISDPHIKVDDNYPLYAEAKALGYFVKWSNGSDFQGNSWPMLSSFFDFLNPHARDYYASWYSYEKFVGSTEVIAGIWNDMNEPSVFNVYAATEGEDLLERTLPMDTVHYGNVQHRDIHNMYGFLHVKSTHHGLMQRDDGKKRPFILSRSQFAGSQRYAAMWTGDNTATWPYLPLSVSECLTSNILGLVFCGADVGGFSGNPDDELLERWYQTAIWLPFFRAHSDKGNIYREPYLLAEEAQDVVRKALRVRYKYIPVWYTLFYEHTRYGDPIIRPFFYHYPELLEHDDHLLLGSDILVRPVMEEGVSSVKVSFPGDENNYWYRVDNDSFVVHPGGSQENIEVDIYSIPQFYRSGSIISRKDIEKPATSHMLNDPYTLYINLDANKTAEGRLYIDDYTSFEYANSQSYLYVTISYVKDSQGVVFNKIDGNPAGFSFAVQQIIVHEHSETGSEGTLSTTYTMTLDGTPLESIDIGHHLNMKTESFILRL